MCAVWKSLVSIISIPNYRFRDTMLQHGSEIELQIYWRKQIGLKSSLSVTVIRFFILSSRLQICSAPTRDLGCERFVSEQECKAGGYHISSRCVFVKMTFQIHKQSLLWSLKTWFTVTISYVSNQHIRLQTWDVEILLTLPDYWVDQTVFACFAVTAEENLKFIFPSKRYCRWFVISVALCLALVVETVRVC